MTLLMSTCEMESWDRSTEDASSEAGLDGCSSSFRMVSFLLGAWGALFNFLGIGLRILVTPLSPSLSCRALYVDSVLWYMLYGYGPPDRDVADMCCGGRCCCCCCSCNRRINAACCVLEMMSVIFPSSELETEMELPSPPSTELSVTMSKALEWKEPWKSSSPNISSGLGTGNAPNAPVSVLRLLSVDMMLPEESPWQKNNDAAE
mmetsp:Transcript_21793/g.62046  ORF Transcript_21793/g.62046 Transcript_21793/m.62046 type:complete len:205 (-) Transcript_21793:5-619(-)